ncbi:hypothetical protein BV898_00323 [Hypsibius exemplaris]|uniref:Uncharacterized protein n=1 Tax=Hypsibius exemplaris TaxID=2072580 RepID=A0A1W0XFF0_HYPEX|nr:hypothetical protein BV898_00323 [Hypsibius exemplaris]
MSSSAYGTLKKSQSGVTSSATYAVPPLTSWHGSQFRPMTYAQPVLYGNVRSPVCPDCPVHQLSFGDSDDSVMVVSLNLADWLELAKWE